MKNSQLGLSFADARAASGCVRGRSRSVRSNDPAASSQKTGIAAAREKLRLFHADRMDREGSVRNFTRDVDAKVVGFGRLFQEMNSFGVTLRIEFQKLSIRCENSEP